MNEQEEKDWWNRPAEPKKPKPTIDELMNQIEKMRLAQEGIPKILIFMQFIALVLITINMVFIYTNLTHPMAFYIAIYMIPLTLILVHYLLVIRQLKLIARGEEK